MIDINLIRTNPEYVKQGIQKKKADPELVNRILFIDEDWRKAKQKLDIYRSEQKRYGESGKIEEATLIKKDINLLEKNLKEREQHKNNLLEEIPNIPFEDVPVGRSEEENVVIKKEGDIPKFDFEFKDYMALAGDDIDMERAAKISGSRFGFIKGEVAELEIAMFRMAMDIILSHGFKLVLPPVMIRQETAVRHGKGGFYIKEGDSFKIDGEDLFLVGSSEHSMIPMFMDEVVDVETPIRMLGYSTCFRREAGSYGRDTKGIFRVRQFNKLEMNVLCKPEESENIHRELLEIQEEIIRKLEIPYRIVEVCTGDMTFCDAKQYDIELWLPSQDKYRESNSCSNTTDFQSRGLKINYKTKGENNKEKRELVHTLNATGLPERPLIAIIENHQNEDGSVDVPSALRPYMQGKEKIFLK